MKQLLNKLLNTDKEETELTKNIQDKKPRNLRTEETKYTPISETE